MRRFLSIFWLPVTLVCLGTIALVIAGISATIMRPSDTVKVVQPAKEVAPVTVTVPGMLELVNPVVTVTVETKSDGQIFAAIGRSEDVKAWAKGYEHVEITGLASWEKLTTKSHAAVEPIGPVPPLDSDMWLVKKTGKSKLTFKWDSSENVFPKSLLVYSDGKVPTTLTLTWKRNVSTPLVVPLVSIGIGLLVLAGLFLLFSRRKRIPGKMAVTGNDLTEKLPIIGEPGNRRPSRKAIREARRAGHLNVIVDGVDYPTGSIPVIRDTSLDLDSILPVGDQGEALENEEISKKLDSSDTDAEIMSFEYEHSALTDDEMVDNADGEVELEFFEYEDIDLTADELDKNDRYFNESRETGSNPLKRATSYPTKEDLERGSLWEEENE